jgi:3-oxoacyl-[acyl-carrier-protein] synthase-3
MGYFKIENVRIAGISACVPKHIEFNTDLSLKNEDISKLIETTGIEQRRVASSEICTSDLCFHAAEKLICDLKWVGGELIDCLIFITQTPDYILPATSCILQQLLKLN